ncbi:MAG: hypothetical protein JSS86_02885 [Cyanobacteria bacterium SZAS LIN-2]|nr:hypothetical protein [Cyanobacteria bacterium SZAS LIN-2]
MKSRFTTPYLAVCLALVMNLQSRTEAAEPATLLKQRSMLAGDTELLVAKNGIKLTMKDKGYALVSTAPRWQLRLINLSEKIYFDTDPKKWVPREQFAASMYRSTNFRSLKTVKSEATTLQGLPAMLMHMIGDQYPQGKSLGKWQKLAVASAEYWGLKSADINPGAAEIIAKVFSMPSSGYLPLQLKGLNHKGRKLDELTLVSVSKVSCSAADFQTGKDYRPVKTEEEVAANGNRGSLLEDMTAP